jgi:WD40 repeat protein
MESLCGHREDITAIASEGQSMARGRTKQREVQPPDAPILRLNTTAHSAGIWRIATDRENRYAVTASDDKTARIWSLADGRLLNVLRVPVGDGNMGRLYAVAMTPDGGTVALGGRTGVSGTEENIYVFDRASGAMRARLSGLPKAVMHLAFSADGHTLAAALGDPNGIRVYDVVGGYELLPSDTAYGGTAYWADFDREGRLVTTSDDGFIRVYAPGRYDAPVAKARGRGGDRPFSALFSPNGQRVAVGYDDRIAVDLLSSQDLTFIQAADTSDVTGPNVFITGWSADGRYLFAGGRGNNARVRRWEDGGGGPHIDIDAGNSTVRELLPLKDRGILFAAEDPAFGIIDAEGHATILQGPSQLNFWNRLGTLKVSNAGHTVEQGTSFPQQTLRLVLTERRLDIDPPADDTLTAPKTEAQDLTVADWEDSYNPTVNGESIALDRHELSRCLTFLPGRDGFILGTEWAVRRFDFDGKLVWRKPAPGVTWGVNVASDGRLIVSTHGDGTIRWFRARDGQELLALFVHCDRKRWILWTPRGYYDASVGADELIGWHVNHGFDEAPDFFLVSRDRFYRPDVIGKVLETLDVDAAVSLADAATGRIVAKPATIAQLFPPVVQIHEPAQAAPVTQTELKVTYSARASAHDPTTRVEAQIDGRNTEAKDQVILADTGDTRVGILTIDLPRRDATVSVIAYNKHGASEPSSVQIIWAGSGSAPRPKLYILAIGVTTYKDARLNLRFPAKDADDFVTTVRDGATGLYDGTRISPAPRDGRWTHDAVLDGLDWIRRQPTSKDVAMIFISGHSVVTPDQVYRFLPSDYDPARMERTTVRGLEFQDFLSKIGGKVLLFLETGYVFRGEAPLHTNVDKFANELAAAENGAVVFASSIGNQFSWERPAWGNGAFAKALIEGLRGRAARANEGVVRISRLEEYVYDRVRDLTDGRQRPMVAKPKMVENFPIVAVKR